MILFCADMAYCSWSMEIESKAVEKRIELRKMGLLLLEEKRWLFVCTIAQLSTLRVTHAS